MHKKKFNTLIIISHVRFSSHVRPIALHQIKYQESEKIVILKSN